MSVRTTNNQQYVIERHSDAVPDLGWGGRNIPLPLTAFNAFSVSAPSTLGLSPLSLFVVTQRPQMDVKMLAGMSSSTQDLHKQHTRLRMDLVNMFDGFHLSLTEVNSI